MSTREQIKHGSGYQTSSKYYGYSRGCGNVTYTKPEVCVHYVRIITQYGSTVYIGIAMGGSSL